jgi:hypothetical protein
MKFAGAPREQFHYHYPWSRFGGPGLRSFEQTPGPSVYGHKQLLRMTIDRLIPRREEPTLQRSANLVLSSWNGCLLEKASSHSSAASPAGRSCVVVPSRAESP